MEVPEIDPNFEPQTRARSNTWPVRPKEFDVDSEGARTPNSVHGELDPDKHEVHEVETIPEDCRIDVVASQKKGGSRRNAWGNLSYADLITKAIQNSPEQRLTLSQIYDWMVQNVPYFRDKGDSNSSAGWKNSIRHNLSLHSRFMRVQNEGTGKSSWWVLNPDAKPGKTPRRRATSMDTKAYEKKRGRVKRKVEQLRSAMEGQALGDGSGYGGSARELNLPDTFNLSTTDFRNRTSSNASSIGRLSPIQYEQDMHDGQVPQMSPLPWQGPPYNGSETFAESITESLAGMLVGDPSMMPPDGTTVQENIVSSSSPIRQQLSPNYQDHNASYLQVGGYSDQLRQVSPQLSPQNMIGGPVNGARLAVTTMSNGYNQVQSVVNTNGMGMRPIPQARHINNYMPPQSLTELLETPDLMDEEVMDQQGGLSLNNGNMMLNTGGGSFQVQSQQQQQSVQQQQQQLPQTIVEKPPQQPTVGPHNTSLLNAKKLANLTPQQRNLITTSLLRQVLCSADPSQQTLLINKLQQQLNTNIVPPTSVSSFQQQQGQQPQYNNYSGSSGGLLNGQSANGSLPNACQLMSDGSFSSQSLSTMSGGTMMSEFDLNLADIRPSDLAGCPDLDQMIKHELSFDDTLDFNFGDATLQASGQGGVVADAQSQQQQQPPQPQQQQYTGPLLT